MTFTGAVPEFLTECEKRSGYLVLWGYYFQSFSRNSVGESPVDFRKLLLK